MCKFGARLLGGGWVGVGEMVQKKMCERLEKQLPDQNSCGKKSSRSHRIPQMKSDTPPHDKMRRAPHL